MGKSFAEWEFQVQSAFMAQGLYSLLCTEVPIRTKADHDRTGRGKYILIRSIDQDLWSDCQFSSARTVLFDPFTTAKACYDSRGLRFQLARIAEEATVASVPRLYLDLLLTLQL